MNYLFLLVTTLVGIHACTFACWLRQKGNTAGALGVYLLVTISVVVALYRVISVG